MGKNLMKMLPLTRNLRFPRAPKCKRGKLASVIFGALRIVKNRVILVFIIATLPAQLLKVLFTHLLTAFSRLILSVLTLKVSKYRAYLPHRQKI